MTKYITLTSAGVAKCRAALKRSQEKRPRLQLSDIENAEQIVLGRSRGSSKLN